MKKLRIGVRGHDVPAENVDSLCSQLCALEVNEIQLVVHKSFPQFIYNRKHIETLAETFQNSGIHIAVYGCYIDPLSAGTGAVPRAHPLCAAPERWLHRNGNGTGRDKRTERRSALSGACPRFPPLRRRRGGA